MKQIQLKYKAFTLVELIVVITILAVLSTIAFISFQGYASNSRDSVRLADMNNISKGFNIKTVKGVKLPLPDDNIEITSSGIVIKYQGYAGQQALGNIDVHGGGVDPLTQQYYTYSTNINQNKFQLLAFFENSNLAYTSNIIYANSFTDRYPKVKGDTLGILLDAISKQPIQVDNNDIDIINTTNEYSIYIDNSNNGIITGDGKELVKSESYNKIYISCEAIINTYGFGINDGIYNINPTGHENIKVYCDMTTDGGGWTLFYANNGNINSIIKDSYITMRDNIVNNSNNYDITDYNNELLAGLINYEPFINLGSNEILFKNNLDSSGNRWGQVKFSNPQTLKWALSKDVLGENLSKFCMNLPDGETWSFKTYNPTSEYLGLNQILINYGNTFGITQADSACNGYPLGDNIGDIILFYMAKENRDDYRARSSKYIGGVWGGSNEYRYFIR